MDTLTITLGITATLTTLAAMWFAIAADAWKRETKFYRRLANKLDKANWILEQREARRIHQCHEAGRTSAERARERREARTSKTTAALCSAPLRPRDEVVAGVRK